MPAIIKSYDPVKNTVTAQIAVRDFWRQLDLSYEWVEIQPCLDVPVVFPRGGGLCLTFPIAAGDECLLVFANRCIDAWWQSGSMSNEGEFRANELSDGFCIPGPWSVPNVVPSISTTSTQLRTNDGTAFVEVTQGGVINITTPQQVHVHSGGDTTVTSGGKTTVNATGNVEVTTAAAATVNAATSITAIAGTSAAVVAGTTASITATGNASVTAASIAVTAAPGGTVTLGQTGQTLHQLVDDRFQAIFNGHTHPDPQGGTTGATTTPMGAGQLTSTVTAG